MNLKDFIQSLNSEQLEFVYGLAYSSSPKLRLEFTRNLIMEAEIELQNRKMLD